MSFSSPRDSDPVVSNAAANGWLVVMLAILTAALVYRTVVDGIKNRPDYTPRVVTPRGDLGADEKNSIEIFELASPSVVNVRTKGNSVNFFGRRIERELASGTGIVWDENGYIVTNLHVVEPALIQRMAELEVVFEDSQVFDAEFVGAVAERDIAVLRIQAPASLLVPVTIGESDNLRVGQQVMAIGNPFGLDRTLSTGVIGGLDRRIRTDHDRDLTGMIQTDAAINPGNSGGPLLDSAGRLIGVNTALISTTGDSSGLGFAVPVEDVLEAVDLIIRSASREGRAALGIWILDRDSIPNLPLRPGVIIGGIFPGSPAERAGLQGSQKTGRGEIFVGDVITAVQGAAVNSREELAQELGRYAVGQTVTLTVNRGTTLFEVPVKLSVRPSPAAF